MSVIKISLHGLLSYLSYFVSFAGSSSPCNGLWFVDAYKHKEDMPPKFIAFHVVLCFERGCPKKMLLLA